MIEKPAQENIAARPMAVVSTLTAESAARCKQDARILIAQALPVDRDVMLAFLNRLGYRADSVEDGREAVKALQAARYDLVLMDCQMPQMDGYHATRLIRDLAAKALHPRTPIVALAAGDMAADREKCIQAGMDDCLSKPVLPDALDRVLDKWLCRPPRTETPHPPAPEQALELGRPVFEHEDLMRRLGGNKALAGMVANAFLEVVPSQLSNLRRQLTVRDVQGGRREAHTMKGAAANISAPVFRSLALEAEQAAEAGEWSTLEELLARMEYQLDRLKIAIAAWE
jgi:CheY-like chemotaxis protein